MEPILIHKEVRLGKVPLPNKGYMDQTSIPTRLLIRLKISTHPKLQDWIQTRLVGQIATSWVGRLDLIQTKPIQ